MRNEAPWVFAALVVGLIFGSLIRSVIQPYTAEVVYVGSDKQIWLYWTCDDENHLSLLGVKMATEEGRPVSCPPREFIREVEK